MFKPLKLLAVICLSIAAGSAGLALLNHGDKAQMALETLSRERGKENVSNAKIVKLRRVQETGGTIASYYTIKFSGSEGRSLRADVICKESGNGYECSLAR